MLNNSVNNGLPAFKDSSCEEQSNSKNLSSFINLKTFNISASHTCDSLLNSSLCGTEFINNECDNFVLCNNTFYINKNVCNVGDDSISTESQKDICSLIASCNSKDGNHSAQCDSYICSIANVCFGHSQCNTYDVTLSNNSTNSIDTARLVLMILLSLLSLVFMIISLIAFTRTKRTPRVGRFLSSWLIAFHAIRQTTILFRSLSGVNSILFHFRIQNVLVAYLTYISITMMSFERALYFQWPNFYLRNLTFARAQRIAYTTWITFYVGAMVMTYIQCPLSLNFNSLIYAQCFIKDISAFGQLAVPVILLICFFSFFIVFRVIKLQMTRVNSEINLRNALSRYKATLTVFFHLVTFSVFTFLLLVNSITLRSLSPMYIILVNDFSSLIRGVFDTLSYVLWFSECRLELMKMLVCAFPSLQSNIETLKMKIFAIQTSEQRSNA